MVIRISIQLILFLVALVVMICSLMAGTASAILINQVEFPDDIRFYRENGDYFQVVQLNSHGYTRINDGPIQWGDRNDVGPFMWGAWIVGTPGGRSFGGFGYGYNGGFNETHWGAWIGGIAAIPLNQYSLTETFYSGPNNAEYKRYETTPAAVLESLKAATAASFGVRDRADYPSAWLYTGSYTLADSPTPEPSGLAGWLVWALAAWPSIRARLR